MDDYDKHGNVLSTEEAKAVVDFIDRWGPVKITFFGGEPLCRKDLFELVAYASARAIRVSVDTNGILLDRESVARLKDAGVSNINVSLDSSDEDTHDSLRGRRGCFRSALEGLELCVAHKIPCLISTYASRRSIRERDLEKIIALAKKMKVSGVKILFPILSGKWRREETQRLNAEEKAYLMDILDPSYVYLEDALQMVTKRGKGCSAIERNLIYISPYGDIQPCPAIPVRLANFRNEAGDLIVRKISHHPLYRRYKSCAACLMNEEDFRRDCFSRTPGDGGLVNAEDLGL